MKPKPASAEGGCFVCCVLCCLCVPRDDEAVDDEECVDRGGEWRRQGVTLGGWFVTATGGMACGLSRPLCASWMASTATQPSFETASAVSRDGGRYGEAGWCSAVYCFSETRLQQRRVVRRGGLGNRVSTVYAAAVTRSTKERRKERVSRLQMGGLNSSSIGVFQRAPRSACL